MLISLFELKASHQNFLYTSEKKCALLQLMLYFLKIRTFNDLKKSVNPWCFWAKQKYWMKYKRESFKHKYENARHWVVIPAFGSLAEFPTIMLAVVKLSLSQSVSGSIAKAVWMTWASKFNVNFNSKGFLLSLDYWLQHFSMTFIYSLIDLKDFISLCLYHFLQTYTILYHFSHTRFHWVSEI